ncbi:MAG: hypothetical protein JNL39_19865 [Opitutaceae bacterium]|nr:hypothetical protein [Opitutaceae bacterium]
MLLDTIIFLVACVAIPLYVLSRPSKDKAAKQEPPPKESSPIAYIVAGTLLAIPAGTAWVIVCFGYLLPGLELTEPNVLSTIKITKPIHRRGPRYNLRLEHTETSLLLTIAAFVFLVFALFLIFRGVRRIRKSPHT